MTSRSSVSSSGSLASWALVALLVLLLTLCASAMVYAQQEEEDDMLQDEDRFEQAAMDDEDVNIPEEEEEEEEEEENQDELDEQFFVTGGFVGSPSVAWPTVAPSITSATTVHHVAPQQHVHVMAPFGGVAPVTAVSPYTHSIAAGYPAYGAYSYGVPTAMYHPVVAVPHPTGYRQDFSSKVNVDHNLRTRPLWGGTTKKDFQNQFTERKLKHCLRRCAKSPYQSKCARRCRQRATKRAANLAADGRSSDFEHRLRHHVHSAPSAHSLRHKEVVHASSRVAAPDWNPYYAMKSRKGNRARKQFMQKMGAETSSEENAQELLHLLSEEEDQAALQLNELEQQQQEEEEAEEVFVEVDDEEEEEDDNEEEEDADAEEDASMQNFSELYTVPTLLGGVERTMGPTGNHINNVHRVKNINHNFSHVSTNTNTGAPVAGVTASGKAGIPVGTVPGVISQDSIKTTLLHSQRSLAEKRADLKRKLDAIKRRHDRLRRFMALKKKLNRVRERKKRLQRMRKLYMRIREKLASWPHIKRALKRKLDRLRLLRRLMALRKRSEGLARRRALAWFGKLKRGRVPRVVRHSVHRELKRRLRPLVHQKLRHHLQEKVHKTLYPYGPRLSTYAGLTRERQKAPFRRMQRKH